MKMKSIQLLALGAILFISGCSALFPPVKTYSGDDLPDSEIAKLTTDSVVIDSIDGNSWKFSTEYQMSPGKHTVVATARVYLFSYYSNLTAQVPSKIEFIAKAGHAYELKADATEVKRISGEQFNARFHYWITDQATGEIVGGAKPANQ